MPRNFFAIALATLSLGAAGCIDRLLTLPAALIGGVLAPLVYSGNIPSQEIEHPMAIVILGGLVTSTLLNLFVVPSLYLHFGRGTLPVTATAGA